jgi:drug/metabolite transporter (DMT)-like permease
MASAEALNISQPQWRPYAILGAGIIVGSIGVIFIREAQLEGIPTMALVAIRMLIVTALLTPIILNHHLPEIRSLKRRDWVLIGFAGANFSIQLIFSFEALNHTSVLISSVIGSSVPLWVALLERFVLKVRFNRLVVNGLLLALGGGIIISLSALSGAAGAGSNPLFGGALSLSSAMLAGAYFIVGRSVRSRASFLTYTWLICIFTAVSTLVICLFSGVSLTGYSTEGYFWVLLVALGPQLVVQSSYNYTLAYLSATFVSLTGQLMTVGNTIAAYLAFHQVPRPLQLFGGAIILIGVMLATLGQNRSAKKVIRDTNQGISS